jgi:hypothetical protein
MKQMKETKGYFNKISNDLDSALSKNAASSKSRPADIEVGLEKPGFKKKKTSPVGFFWYFWVFWFFFYIFAQKREFLGFFQYQEYFRVHPDFKL